MKTGKRESERRTRKGEGRRERGGGRESALRTDDDASAAGVLDVFRVEG